MMNPSVGACRCIYVAANAQQAQLLAAALEVEGIVAYVSNDALQTGIGGLPPGYDTAPRVMAAEADADRAREIALEFDRKLRQLQGEASPGRAWYQITIRGLFLLMVCVVIGIPNFGSPALAVVLFALGALYLAFRGKRRGARS